MILHVVTAWFLITLGWSYDEYNDYMPHVAIGMIPAKLYDENDLTHTMFPLTRSCEGSDYEAGNYTWHCGKCWWCEERMWAFGFLDNPPQQFIYD